MVGSVGYGVDLSEQCSTRVQKLQRRGMGECSHARTRGAISTKGSEEDERGPFTGPQTKPSQLRPSQVTIEDIERDEVRIQGTYMMTPPRLTGDDCSRWCPRWRQRSCRFQNGGQRHRRGPQSRRQPPRRSLKSFKTPKLSDGGWWRRRGEQNQMMGSTLRKLERPTARGNRHAAGSLIADQQVRPRPQARRGCL
jgi:hypothetical protein